MSVLPKFDEPRVPATSDFGVPASPTLRAQWAAGGRADRAALVGLAIFAYIGVQGPGGAKLGLLILLVATVARWTRFWRSLKWDPVFWAVMALGFYVFVRAAPAAAEFPEHAAHQWREAIRIMLPALLLVVAWWLRADHRRILMVLGAALAGLLTQFLIHTDWSAPLQGRYELGYTELASALYGGVAILGILAFLPRWWRLADRRGSPLDRLALKAVPLALLLVLLCAQLITQSRAAWLSLAVLVPLVLAATYSSERRGMGSGHRPNWKIYAAALITMGLLVAFNANKIMHRLMAELPEVEEMVESGFNNTFDSSIGIRVGLLRYGASLVAMRPWFGWGPGTESADFLAKQLDRPLVERYGHLHNLYLMLVVRLGALGALLYAAVVGLLLYSGWRGFRQGNIPWDTAIFLGATILLTAAWSMINERLTRPDFLFFIMFLFAVVHTFNQPARRAPENANAGAVAGEYRRSSVTAAEW